MKKTLFAVILLMVTLTLGAACAQEAQNISSQCAFTGSTRSNIARLTDQKIKMFYDTGSRKDAYIEITTPADTPCCGLYIIWKEEAQPWAVQKCETLADGSEQWTTVTQGGRNPFVHDYLEVPALTRLRIVPDREGKASLQVAELAVLSAGELPASVQVWQPTPEKAGLMLLVAHPDDEYIFMGGLIPTYAGQQNKNVVVAYMTYGNRTRRTELLNGLWLAGLRTYPVIGDFYDGYSAKLDKGYDVWGKQETLKYVTGLFRQYQPEVVVTHDLEGEYGHGAHRVCGDASMKCFAYAADASQYEDLAAQYGVWQVKKLYLHLYPENQITLDWNAPLEAFDGQTSLEVAAQAFECHVTQQGCRAKLRDGSLYYFAVDNNKLFDNSLFGLCASAVGADAEKNDFFENIP